MKFTTICFLVLLMFTACETQKEKTTKTYEEAIALSNEATTAKEKGDREAAAASHAKAIEKLNETLQLDSTHKTVRGDIADRYFENEQYTEALEWYAKANQVEGENAENLRNMGLSKLWLEKLDEGQALLTSAVELDHSTVLRDNTIKSLMTIGEKKFLEGAEHKNKGEAEAAKAKQTYAMNILMLTYYFDNTRKDVAGRIATYADEVGDYTVKMQYTKLSQQ